MTARGAGARPLAGGAAAEALGRYHFTVAGWTDTYASWVEELRKRVAARRPDVASEIAEGLAMVAKVVPDHQRRGTRTRPRRC
jgi:hypothetical protein